LVKNNCFQKIRIAKIQKSFDKIKLKVYFKKFNYKHSKQTTEGQHAMKIVEKYLATGVG
jgi:hypothetical protein